MKMPASRYFCFLFVLARYWTYVRTKQLGIHWADFRNIWCLGSPPPTPPKMCRDKVSLKSGKNNGNLKTNILLSLYLAQLFLDWGMSQTNVNTSFRGNNFCENRGLYKCGNNITQPDRLRMTVWRVRLRCWIIKATNAHSEYVILNCFSSTTVVARTGLSVTFYLHCLYCFVRKLAESRD